MKKKFKNFTIILLFCILLLTILANSSLVTEKVLYGANIWLKKIFPSLFPFFLITDLLINYNFIYYLSKLFDKMFKKLFHVSGTASFIYFLSLFAGNPANAKYTKDLLEKKMLSKQEADFILGVSFFTNPLFILSFANLIFNNYKYGFIIIFAHYISTIFVGFIMKPKKVDYYAPISPIKPQPLIPTLSSSIEKTFNILFLILGIIITFTVLNTLLAEVFRYNSFTNLIISNILEISQGLNNMIYVNLPNLIKLYLFVGFISFGGLSIHLQVNSIISDSLISYKTFFKCRIWQAIISIIIAILFTTIFNI